MKAWGVTFVAGLVLANSQFVNALEGEDPPGFRSPQCTQGLSKIEIDALKHFNGVFGSFTVDINKNSNLINPSMYGPIAALNIKADGYGFNMKSQDTECSSSDRLLRVGLLADQADVKGDVHGSVVRKSGSVEATSQSEACYKSSAAEDMSDSLFAFAPKTLRVTSEHLAAFAPDTLIDRKTFAISSANSNRSFKGYRIVKFPACSDSDCVAAIPRKETSISIFKAGSTPQGQYQRIPSDEMIVFNVPVYVGNQFTITTLDVNRNISPCQIIYNFFPVDKRGNYVSDPKATFTLVRPAGVTITGTILAPQANIMDAETGYFGGQLLTLQNYEGKGADIKDFSTASNGQCSSRSLCIPAEHIAKVVTQVVTATAVSTELGTTTILPVERRAIPEDVTTTVHEENVVVATEVATVFALTTLYVDADNEMSSVAEEKDDFLTAAGIANKTVIADSNNSPVPNEEVEVVTEIATAIATAFETVYADANGKQVPNEEVKVATATAVAVETVHADSNDNLVPDEEVDIITTTAIAIKTVIADSDGNLVSEVEAEKDDKSVDDPLIKVIVIATVTAESAIATATVTSASTVETTVVETRVLNVFEY